MVKTKKAVVKKAAPKKASTPKKKASKPATPSAKQPAHVVVELVIKNETFQEVVPGRLVSPARLRGAAIAAVESQTATVHVTFTGANAGVSDFTATHNGANPQSLQQSGTVSFKDVLRGDTIEISSDSPGEATVTMSGVNTYPTAMKAVPGQHIADFFLVV